ncbi:NapC/NirT family cytochrome c [Bradyrhizobium sp.]|uniref:NapC/NirT family cytochrome c n=1 Tax=Bradyrhizobium sp. TaxID=376 RepID=UPI003C7728D9
MSPFCRRATRYPCRNCHSVESMDPHKQSQASQVMLLALKNGATCIDCHRGIAHHLPK